MKSSKPDTVNKPRLSPQTVAELVNYASSGLVGMLYTDAELFEKMNEQLPDPLKICHRTFQRYKAAALQYGEMATGEQQKHDPLYADLYHAFVRTGMKQKENLVQKMLDADGNKWHRYKWLLEKKFPEFNQGCIMETFRRENSYLDEDFPMYHPKKHPVPQSVFISEIQPEPQAVAPAAETSKPIIATEKREEKDDMTEKLLQACEMEANQIGAPTKSGTVHVPFPNVKVAAQKSLKAKRR